jgi:hypothetical protein
MHDENKRHCPGNAFEPVASARVCALFATRARERNPGA